MATILVIDDCESFRWLTRLALEAGGYRVIEADEGAKGLTLYLNGGVDLVLCDVFLPDRDGLETLMALRRHRPDAKVVAMSGGFQDRLDLLPTAARLGASGVLRKPFTQAALLGLVKDVLRSLESDQPGFKPSLKSTET
jgi:two-component system response regulator (stage 0 sporulation protein F)